MSDRAPRFRDRLEDAALTAALALGGLVGEKTARRVGARLGRFGYRPLGIRRAQVEANLRTAFPDRDPDWIRRTAAASYAHLGRESVSTLLASRSPGVVPGPVSFQGIEVLHEGLRAGRGLVLVAGHLGNWELGVGAVASAGFPVTAVARRQRNPLFDRRVVAVRRGFGLVLVEPRHATRKALAALRENRIVLLVADQDARGAGVFVPFFNRPASTPRGPAVLAHRAGAPLAFFAPVRAADGGLVVRFEALDTPAVDNLDEAVAAVTRLFVARLEAAIRAAPEQYLWHHRRWKTKPPAAPQSGPAGSPRP